MRSLGLRLVIGLFAIVAGCSRRAEIADTPDGAVIRPTPMTMSDAALVEVDAGLAESSLCAEREVAPACTGANDFPCNFLGWVTTVIGECQTATDCRANGLVGVDMNEAGCVSGISMSEPNDAFAACLGQRFSSARCLCGALSTREFLGSGNAGCLDTEPVPCSSSEFPCEVGKSCVEGFCVDTRDAGNSP